MKSELFRLAKNDYVRGFLMAVIGAVLGVIYTGLLNKTGVDMKIVLDAGLLSGVGYLIKNFFSDSDGKFLGKI